MLYSTPLKAIAPECPCNKDFWRISARPRHALSRASSDFGPSQEWLQRKQGGRGNGTAAGSKDGFSFLRPERREAWKATLAEDGQRQV